MAVVSKDRFISSPSREVCLNRVTGNSRKNTKGTKTNGPLNCTPLIMKPNEKPGLFEATIKTGRNSVPRGLVNEIRPNPLLLWGKPPGHFCLLQNLGHSRRIDSSHVMLSWALFPGDTMLVFISWFPLWPFDIWSYDFGRLPRILNDQRWVNGMQAFRKPCWP